MGIIKMKTEKEEQVNQAVASDAAYAVGDAVRKEDETEFFDPAVLYEDASHTDEHSRLYYLNNNTAKSIVSAEAVNYYDEDAKKWRRIDNTFVDKGDTFETKSGAYKTAVSKADCPQKSVRISKKDYGVSWTYLGKQSAASVASANISQSNVQKSNVLLHIENSSEAVHRAGSRAVYENIENDTDLEYCLQGNNLKENIIVREKSDDYRYLFALDSQGLKMRLSEDNLRIELYSDGGETKFTIPAPYMYDAAGASSDDVYYELAQNENGGYTFAVVASADWINSDERVFPVTIDPQVVVDGVTMTKQVQRRCFCSSDSSGTSSSSWTNVSYSNIRVSRNDCEEYRTLLTIRKSELSLLKHKMSSVKLK